jgi:hypothetical protein
LTTKDRKEQRWEAIRLDDHLIATGQVALRGGMLDNLIELTAEQLILRRSPIVRQSSQRRASGLPATTRNRRGDTCARRTRLAGRFVKMLLVRRQILKSVGRQSSSSANGKSPNPASPPSG